MGVIAYLGLLYRRTVYAEYRRYMVVRRLYG
jgi:hypothetical protein